MFAEYRNSLKGTQTNSWERSFIKDCKYMDKKLAQQGPGL